MFFRSLIKEGVMDILERYSKNNRLPTTKECICAVEYPQTAEHWVERYLELYPEYNKFIQFRVELKTAPIDTN